METPSLTIEQQQIVESQGLEHNGVYIWSYSMLEELLELNREIFPGSVDDFLRLIISRNGIFDEKVLCLIHAAFLDNFMFIGQGCENQVVLPESTRNFIEIMKDYPMISPTIAWPIFLHCPTNFGRRQILNIIKDQMEVTDEAFKRGRECSTELLSIKVT